MIAREPFTPALLAELRPLIEENHAATGMAPERLAPRWEVYDQMQAAGLLRVYVARRHTGAVAWGYAAFVVQPSPNYAEVWAAAVAIVATREARRCYAGVALLETSERLLRAEGVQVIAHSVPTGQPAMGQTLLGLGYERAEVVWRKRVA